ncbi:MAG: ABC transporter ATP-binding protein [Sedimentisphaerales bacterium]|nr:ABC transporter ATP-binding protein [Sedimentisphaerales bacterium]
MSEDFLKLSDIHITRAGKTILHIDHLHIQSGQFVNIIGTNGAGKTTLLKVICGLLKPSAGSVVFNHILINSLNPWQKSNIRKRIGYIPQSTEYNSELPFTAREVAAMGRTSIKPLLTGLSRADYEHVDFWMEKLGLNDQKNQTFRSLSGGEQQKVLIARAMVQEPLMLMLDEPTSNLDFNWKLRISRIVRELHQQPGLTVLMVSHEISSIPVNVDRTILLHKGGILADGNSEQVLTSAVIQDVYECEINIFETEGNKYVFSRELSRQ